MESLNTGYVVDKVAEESWEQAAKDFSEGNEDLRKLLLYCFQNNLETKACCAGHPEKFDGYSGAPYILFEYNENSSQAVLSIIRNMMSEKGVTLELGNTNAMFGKYFQIDFNSLEANWSAILKACQTREKDGKKRKLPSQMRRIVEFIEDDKENTYATEFRYDTDDKMFNSIFSEIDEDIVIVDSEKYCFKKSGDEYEQNGVLQQTYWFGHIPANKIKKLLKKFSKLRDEADKSGKYLKCEKVDDSREELKNAINGHSTPEDYEKADQEWENRVPVDKGDLDKTSIERQNQM